MMEENVIEVKQLSKRFQTTVALQGCDFAVRKGEIFGFLGPSGAGKKMCIRDRYRVYSISQLLFSEH